MGVKGGLLNKLNDRKKDNGTTNLVENNEPVNSEEGIPALLSLLRLGTSAQKHDAAKAIGYLGKLGQMPADVKIEAKNVLTDILQNEYPSMTNAFAMIEALMRIDDDAFWTLVMAWYGQATKNVPNALNKMK